jgi:mitochondrial translocator assembly and maintenance protein 41
MSGIVRYPATIQTLKGVVSGGPVTTVRYSLDKLGKWWAGFKGRP